MNDDTLDTTPDKLDLDGDGEGDALGFDDNADGQYDWIQADLDGDGYAETAIVDADFDGEFDVIAIDVDGDGAADELYDATTGEVLSGEGASPVSSTLPGETDQVPTSSGDGIVLDQTADEIDTDGDGVTDVFAYDDDGDGEYDYLEVDVDGDGVVDGAIVDDDFDGVFDTVLADEDGDGTIEVYDIETGEQIDEISPEGTGELPEEGLPGGDSPVNFPAGSPFQL